MQSYREIFETISKKQILIDSCIWIKSYSYQKDFASLFTLLSATECVLLTLPSIKFEVLRSVGNENLENISHFMDYWVKDSTAFSTSISRKHSEIADRALKIARYYHNHHHTSASFIDCYLSASILDRVTLPEIHETFILTENCKDFPQSLFTPIYVNPIAIKHSKTKATQILTPTILQVNKKEAKRLLK